MHVLELINALRESDPYIKTIFTEGSCYRFFMFLQSIYPSAVPLINHTDDHICALIDGDGFDINGIVDLSGWRVCNEEDLAMASKWSFSKKSFLSIGECPACEEPLIR